MTIAAARNSPARSSPARTLTESLRQRSPAGVITLLQLRPDLRAAAPHDLAELTAQAVTSRSVARAVDGLNAWQRQVAEALAALPDPTDVAAVAALLGVPPSTCAAAVDDLRQRALLWGPDDGLHLVRAAREQFGPYPGALAPPSPRPLPTDQVAELLTGCDPAAMTVLERLAWSPTGALPGADRPVTPDSARGPVEQLLARRLLSPLDGETVILPREVAWEVRGHRFSQHPVGPEAPAVTGRQRPVELIDRAAVGAAYGLVHDLEQLAHALESRPHRLLRDGGLGQRDVVALARELHGEPEYAGFLLECAAAATIVGSDPAGRLLPTREYDRWLRLSSAERWCRIARAWHESPRFFSRALQSDGHPLGPEGDLSYATAFREVWLDRVVVAGTGLVPDRDDVEQAVRWQRPRLARVPLRLGQGLEWLRRESAWLGLTALEATSSLAGWLARPGQPLPTDLAALFPEPVESIILQADLTAVAAGPLPHALAGELRLLATQESRGGGGVYRFSSASIRRAFDAGWSAAEVRNWLAEHSATPVPQPLSYLIADVARQHGSIRVGTAATYLSIDDPARPGRPAGRTGGRRPGTAADRSERAGRRRRQRGGLRLPRTTTAPPGRGPSRVRSGPEREADAAGPDAQPHGDRTADRRGARLGPVGGAGLTDGHDARPTHLGRRERVPAAQCRPLGPARHRSLRHRGRPGDRATAHSARPHRRPVARRRPVLGAGPDNSVGSRRFGPCGRPRRTRLTRCGPSSFVG